MDTKNKNRLYIFLSIVQGQDTAYAVKSLEKRGYRGKPQVREKTWEESSSWLRRQWWD